LQRFDFKRFASVMYLQPIHPIPEYSKNYDT